MGTRACLRNIYRLFLKILHAAGLLDDPRLNFSLSSNDCCNSDSGIDHVGLQADTAEELAEIQQRLQSAGEETLDQPEAECCYAKSAKTWVRDPDDVAWEAFVTFGEISEYGEDGVPAAVAAGSDCCKTESACCGSER